MSIKLVITFKDQPVEVTANEDNTIRWVKEQLQKHTKVPIIQQELFVKIDNTKKVFSDNQMPLKVAQLPLELTMKNLGKQVRWENVFFIEYLGPIVIMPLFYFLGNRHNYTEVQNAALVMGVLHYLKREYETAFVHVFSHQSMPFKRVLINSIHYWVLFALLNSIQLYLFPSGRTINKSLLAGLFAFWCFCQTMNYKCHALLASFRRNPKLKAEDGYQNASKARQIPHGYGFGLVSCANYFWEALGWLTFAIVSGNYSAVLFLVFSVVQMAKWAKDKHRRYKKEFGDKYPKGRKAMFPFIY